LLREAVSGGQNSCQSYSERMEPPIHQFGDAFAGEGDHRNSELLETRTFSLHLIYRVIAWDQQFGCFCHTGGVY
jgi:hypothetical protein